MSKRLFAFVLLFFMFCFANFGYAENAPKNEELQSELDSINLQLEYMKLKVGNTKKKLRALEGRARAKKSELEVLSKQFQLHAEKRQNLDAKLSDIRKKIDESRKQTKGVLLRYRRSLVQLHKIKQNALISSAFSSKSLNTFLNKYQMVKYMLRNDQEMVDAIRSQSQKLSQRMQLADKMNKRLDSLQEELKAREDKLKSASKALNAMLSTLVIEKKIFLARQKKLQKSSLELNSKIQKIENERKKNEVAFEKEIDEKTPAKIDKVTVAVQSPDRGNGADMMNFLWPLTTSKIQNVSSAKNDDKAIEIYLKSDSEVHSVARGKIMYKGNLGSLGSVVIIGHKRGFSSVYAGMNDIWAGLGQVVAQGEVIGKMYSNQGSSLHFEIRFGGKKKNPLSYLPKLK